VQLANKTRWVAILVVIILGVVASGTILAQSTLQILLNEQNGSGESGTASLAELGNGMILVEVVVNGAPEGVSQPMHIHEGTCADLNPAPKFPLQNLETGLSTTEISATLETLLASPHAINGHKSAEEASVYVFCGDIMDASMQDTTTAEPTGAATPEASGEASTPVAEATPAPQLPSTGAASPLAALIPIAILGIVAIVIGFSLRDRGRREM
jgi:hypothetical protein